MRCASQWLLPVLLIGGIIWLGITGQLTQEAPAAQAPWTPPAGVSQLACTVDGKCASYVADATIPDGSELEAGTPQTKTWTVKNTGQTTWRGYKLVLIFFCIGEDGWKQVNGEKLFFDIPDTEPGQEQSIELKFTAPQQPGTYSALFELADHEGNRFGDPLFTIFTVK